jgi:hypothetical protein
MTAIWRWSQQSAVCSQPSGSGTAQVQALTIQGLNHLSPSWCIEAMQRVSTYRRLPLS